MSPRVLFLGLGQTAVAYYRCVLPALFLRASGFDADWLCVSGEPPKLNFDTGLIQGSMQLPSFQSYDAIVVQQPRGHAWFAQIKRWQDRGKRVIFEVDDYLHAIRKMTDHDWRADFSKKELERLELNMRACDAVICSTEFIASRYRKFNRRTFVCENGLDLGRYQLTRPDRPVVNIGWAGGTGHAKAAVPWLRELAVVMEHRPDVCAVTIGINYADALKRKFGETRAVSVPWTLIDTYPAAMTLMDVALAPAGKGDFFRGKSDLRWLEAGALGIPTIADPSVYGRIEHGVTGFLAESPDEARGLMLDLIADKKLRLEVGDNAREYVRDKRNMVVMAEQWRQALCEVLGEREAA